MTYSILIVDDESAIKDSVQAYLEMLSYRVEGALSGEEALEKIKTFSADVVLTDIMMAGMDGLELTRQIKENFDADVIVMTGYNADYSYEEAIRSGASDFIFKPFRFGELDLRIRRVLREAESKRERAKLLKKLEQMAFTDALTGLFNSRHFFHQIKQERERHLRYSRSLSLMMLDIDFFKNYNDTWGHLEGDQVLMTIGKTIQSCMRSMDTAYRYGGEEFAILLPETSLSDACVVGERIRKKIELLTFTPEPDQICQVTISIGAATLKPEESYTDFIRRADQALYTSKDDGRNRTTCAD
jgi:two-component system, cell cycle response regulator